MNLHPRNRTRFSLPNDRIEIEDADGVLVMGLEEFEELAQSGCNELRPMANRQSVLSKRPAVVYRSMNLEVPLTPEEVQRLGSIRLDRREIRKLRRQYGMAHEWQEDFYPL